MEKTGYIRLTSQVKNEKRNSKCWAAIDAVFTFFGENDKKSVKAKKVCVRRGITSLLGISPYYKTCTLRLLIFTCIYFRELKHSYSARNYFREKQVLENFASTNFCKWQVFGNFAFINFCESAESEKKMWISVKKKPLLWAQRWRNYGTISFR